MASKKLHALHTLLQPFQLLGRVRDKSERQELVLAYGSPDHGALLRRPLLHSKNRDGKALTRKDHRSRQGARILAMGYGSGVNRSRVDYRGTDRITLHTP